MLWEEAQLKRDGRIGVDSALYAGKAWGGKGLEGLAPQEVKAIGGSSVSIAGRKGI